MRMEGVEGELAIDIREGSSARRKLSVLSEESMASDNCTIIRAPALVRQRNKHLYEAQTVAIGPYGRRNDDPSLRAMERLKRRYLKEFLSRCSNSAIDHCVDEIQKLEPEARRCYFERVDLTTEKFVEMLLLDGCFILEFLIKWKLPVNHRFSSLGWSLQFVHDDLLLLENQIPLFVLDKLFEIVKPTLDGSIPYSLMELLVDYLTCMSLESPVESSEEPMRANSSLPGEAKDFDHLLHLYYRCYVTEPQTDPTGRTICCTILKWLRPSGIFILLPSKICRSHTKRLPRTIPSATELLKAGVTIKKKEKKKKKKKNENETHEKRLSAFLDVAFEDGVLEIPFLSVDPSTLPRFTNLVAFEQCGGCEGGKAYMTSYAVFMNCLVDKREDVAVLHQRGILENKLGSDEDLAVFFNQLSDWAYMDLENHYLVELFRDVREYCGSPWPKWRAKLVRDYFGNPWAILSLFAAAVLLILTILQTVYTIYPYYHPRN